jgi:hypothetical protein
MNKKQPMDNSHSKKIGFEASYYMDEAEVAELYR